MEKDGFVKGTNQAGALEERNVISYSKCGEIRGLCGQGAKRCKNLRFWRGPCRQVFNLRKVRSARWNVLKRT